VFDFLLELLR